MFKMPDQEQRQLAQECGIDPEGYVVTVDNDRMLCMLHLKTRNEVMIIKNRSEKKW